MTYKIFPQKGLIKLSTSTTCSTNADCSVLSGEACFKSVCTLYSSSIDGLTHFWRFENQTLTDSIGDNTLVVRRAIETTYAYNYDHNYERNGCLRMNDGYLTFLEV